MYLRNDKENGWITLGLLFKCLFNACHSLSVPILFLWFLHQSEKIQIQVSGCLPEHSRRAIETRFTSSRKKKILLRLLNTCASTYGHGSFVPSKRKSPRSLPEPPCQARAEMHTQPGLRAPAWPCPGPKPPQGLRVSAGVNTALNQGSRGRFWAAPSSGDTLVGKSFHPSCL